MTHSNRWMAAFSFGVFACGAMALYVAYNRPEPPADAAAADSQIVILSSDADPKHPVTDKMLEVTGRMASVAAPLFEAQAADGRTVRLADLLGRGKPIVMISVLDGCPCNTDAQPLFNRLYDRYRHAAHFLNVIASPIEKAQIWAHEHDLQYPILADPDLKILRPYKSERSVYVTLIRPDGGIDKMWPGYSADMLIELDTKLAQITGLDVPRFDPLYAPTKLSSGCQIFSGEAVPPNADANH
ncbi:MAG: redoxin domain-containing protein [Fimbriimonadaceae bacterium]